MWCQACNLQFLRDDLQLMFNYQSLHILGRAVLGQKTPIIVEVKKIRRSNCIGWVAQVGMRILLQVIMISASSCELNWSAAVSALAHPLQDSQQARTGNHKETGLCLFEQVVGIKD